jgi:MFS superfamily sulfate permease-like transporter
VVPLLTLGRGLSLSSYRREWLVRDIAAGVALASMLALMVAAIMILAAVAKLGFIADLISKPTMIGYMDGLALTILAGQLPKLDPVRRKIERYGLTRTIASRDFFPTLEAAVAAFRAETGTQWPSDRLPAGRAVPGHAAAISDPSQGSPPSG